MKLHSITALALCATFASGLTSAQGFDPEKVTGKITFYTHFNQFVDDGRWGEWSAQFTKAYPGTEVEILPVSGYRKEMPTRIASGDYGDVLNVLDNLPPSDYPTFYLPLNDMAMEEHHQFVDRFSVDGSVYGFIYGVNAEAMVYNKVAFEKAGIDAVPETRAELFEACEKLKAADITPMALNMGAGWPMQQWDKAALLFAEDGDYYEKMLADPAPFAKGKPYGESLSFVNELFEAGCTERDYTANNWDQSRALIGIGEIGMWFLANWSIPQAVAQADLMGVDASEDLGMFPLPVNDSGEPKVLLNPDWALGVAKNTKNPDTAKAWIEFLLTKTDVANAAGFIPGDTRLEATMPQLQELLSNDPGLVNAGTPSAKFKQAMADARLDFMTGTYIREVILASDFDAALDELNERWARAISR